MPHLLPSTVFNFDLNWIGAGGRLVWAVIFTTIGLLWVMLLMKHPAVTHKLAGPGILVVGTGAGIAMVIAGKTVMENSLTGDTLIPFGFMIAWFSFIGGLWGIIMSLNVSQLNLPIARKNYIAISIAFIVACYVVGGIFGKDHAWVSIVTSWLIFVAIMKTISVVLWTLPHRAEDATWAEAIFGALCVFVMMTFIYAIIPHEWITFATSYLGFTKDVKLSPGGEFVLQTWLNGNFWTKRTRVIPFELNMEVIQDHATLAIYIINATLNIKLFAAWQKRNTAVAVAEETETSEAPKKTSRFGRPLRALKTSKA